MASRPNRLVPWLFGLAVFAGLIGTMSYWQKRANADREFVAAEANAVLCLLAGGERPRPPFAGRGVTPAVASALGRLRRSAERKVADHAQARRDFDAALARGEPGAVYSAARNLIVANGALDALTASALAEIVGELRAAQCAEPKLTEVIDTFRRATAARLPWVARLRAVDEYLANSAALAFDPVLTAGKPAAAALEDTRRQNRIAAIQRRSLQEKFAAASTIATIEE
jgi:hypothetical protein